MPIKEDADRLTWGNLEATAPATRRAVHIDALTEIALEDLGHLEGVNDIASRTDDGAEESGLAAADEAHR